MSDNRQWQSPGTPGPVPPPPAATPPAGPPPPSGPPIGQQPPYGAAPPSYAAPAFVPAPGYPATPGHAAAPGYPATPGYPTRPGYPAGPVGWTPPPRPGLVPLRPLTLGMILAGAFGTLRRSPLATIGPALVVSLVVALVQGLGSIGFLTSTFGSLADPGAAAADIDSILGGELTLALTAVGAGLLSIVATAIIQSAVTLSVTSGTVGERLRFGPLWRRMRGRRWAVIGWALLLLAFAVVVLAVLVGIVALIAVSSGSAGPVVAVILSIVFLLGLLALYLWLWTKLAFVPAALVVERLRFGAAIARSWRLSIGSFWRVLGIRLLMVVMIGAASQVISLPIQFIAGLVSGLLLPNGETASSGVTVLVVTTIASQTLGAVIAAIGLVLNTATAGLLYVDLRMRREGLDLELVRYAEVPPAQRAGLPDPFRAPEWAA